MFGYKPEIYYKPANDTIYSESMTEAARKIYKHKHSQINDSFYQNPNYDITVQRPVYIIPTSKEITPFYTRDDMDLENLRRSRYQFDRANDDFALKNRKLLEKSSLKHNTSLKAVTDYERYLNSLKKPWFIVKSEIETEDYHKKYGRQWGQVDFIKDDVRLGRLDPPWYNFDGYRYPKPYNWNRGERDRWVGWRFENDRRGKFLSGAGQKFNSGRSGYDEYYGDKQLASDNYWRNHKIYDHRTNYGIDY